MPIGGGIVTVLATGQVRPHRASPSTRNNVNCTDNTDGTVQWLPKP